MDGLRRIGCHRDHIVIASIGRMDVDRLPPGVGRFLDRVRSIALTGRSTPIDTTGSDTDPTRDDPETQRRRSRERALFANDAEYFEFLVDRAVRRGASGA
jgi:hypothetical protein